MNTEENDMEEEGNSASHTAMGVMLSEMPYNIWEERNLGV